MKLLSQPQSVSSSVTPYSLKRQHGVCGAGAVSADQTDCGSAESWHFERVNDRVDQRISEKEHQSTPQCMESAVERHSCHNIMKHNNHCGNDDSREVSYKRSCRDQEHGGREFALLCGPQVILRSNGTALEFDPNTSIAEDDEQENKTSLGGLDGVICKKRYYSESLCYAEANQGDREKPDDHNCEAIISGGECTVIHWP